MPTIRSRNPSRSFRANRLCASLLLALAAAAAHGGQVTVTQNGATIASCTFSGAAATFGPTGDIAVTCDTTGGGGGSNLTLSIAGGSSLYEGASAATVTVTRPNGTGAATIEVTVSGGTLDTDFTLSAAGANTISGRVASLQFADGVTTSSFTITPRPRNGTGNPATSLSIAVTNAGGYTAGSTQGATVLDSTVAMSPASQTLTASGANGTINVTRAPGAGTATVAVTATGGTVGADYTLSTGANGSVSGNVVTLNFPAGTASLPITVTPLAVAATTALSFAFTGTDDYTAGSAGGVTINPAGVPGCSNTGATAWANFNRPGLSTAGALYGGATQGFASYSFSVSATDFPNGVMLLLNNSAMAAYNPRDHFISECSGNFTNYPAASPSVAACQVLNAQVGRIYLGLTTNPASQGSNTCNLEPGKTYYLNLRTVEASGVHLSSGFLLDTRKR